MRSVLPTTDKANNKRVSPPYPTVPNTPPRYTLRSWERLKGHKIVETLFAQGNSFTAFPLRFIWLLQSPPDDAATHHFGVRFGVSVPKRWFKRANLRNTLKRQMREAYRLQKHPLGIALQNSGICADLAIMCIFAAKSPGPYADIHSKMAVGLQRVAKELKRQNRPADPS